MVKGVTSGYAQKLSHLTADARNERQHQIDAAQHRVRRDTLSRKNYTAFKAELDAAHGIEPIHAKSISPGDRFGKLKVLSIRKNKFGQTEGICLCDCGGTATVTAAKLNSGYTKSCGCLRREKRKPDLSIRHKFTDYKATARQRNLSFDLDFNQFKSLAIQPCCYCGSNGTGVVRSTATGSFTETVILNGIDRQDNSKGYTLKNSVSCCKACNYAKGKMPLSEFVAWGLRFVGEPAPAASGHYSAHSALSNQFAKYRQVAYSKHLDFKLSFDQFSVLTTSACHYCTAKPYRIWRFGLYAATCNGVDRLDNAKGYTVENAVPCCPQCNYAKRGMTEAEFRTWALRLGNSLMEKLTSSASNNRHSTN